MMFGEEYEILSDLEKEQIKDLKDLETKFRKKEKILIELGKKMKALFFNEGWKILAFYIEKSTNPISLLNASEKDLILQRERMLGRLEFVNIVKKLSLLCEFYERFEEKLEKEKKV